MKFYGCLANRLEEGKQFVNEIKVGTGVTEYYYSDRKPFEVIDVINQKHIVIRELDSKRIDNNGMSDSQSYEYISNPKNVKYELVLRNGTWFKVYEINKNNWLARAEQMVKENSFKTCDAAYRYIKAMAGLTDKQYEKVELGKSVKKYIKMNISIGFAEKYHDYTF